MTRRWRPRRARAGALTLYFLSSSCSPCRFEGGPPVSPFSFVSGSVRKAEPNELIERSFVPSSRSTLELPGQLVAGSAPLDGPPTETCTTIISFLPEVSPGLPELLICMQQEVGTAPDVTPTVSASWVGKAEKRDLFPFGLGRGNSKSEAWETRAHVSG